MPLRVAVDGGVARVTIDHPPTNLLDLELILAFDHVGKELAADDDVRVVVVDSIDPEIWVAHADVQLILDMPDDADVPVRMGFVHSSFDRFRTMPKATIAVIDGVARGGGSELALSMDMRFGSIERCVLGQPESLLGIIPGGSGTQRLPRLVGRGRALEAMLGGADVDAVTAERWGWIDRALPRAELRPYVDDLARRMASVPADVIAEIKRCADLSLGPVESGLIEEGAVFHRVATTDEARTRMRAYLERGGQRRASELRPGGAFSG